MILFSKVFVIAVAVVAITFESLIVSGTHDELGQEILHKSFEDNINEYEQRIRRLGGYGQYNGYSSYSGYGKNKYSNYGKNGYDGYNGKNVYKGKYGYDYGKNDYKGSGRNGKYSSGYSNKGGLLSKVFNKFKGGDDSSSSSSRGDKFGRDDSSSSGGRKSGLLSKIFRKGSDSSDTSNGRRGDKDSSSSNGRGRRSNSDDSSSGRNGKVSRRSDSGSSSSEGKGRGRERGSSSHNEKGGSDDSSISNGKSGFLSKIWRKFSRKGTDSSSGDDDSSSSGGRGRGRDSSDSSNGKRGSSSRGDSSDDSSGGRRRKGGKGGKGGKNDDKDDDKDNNNNNDDRSALRINCGGLGTDDKCEDYRYFNVNGDLWFHDCEYQDDEDALIFKVNDDIYDIDDNDNKMLADDQEIYQSERFIREKDLVYNFDVNNGRYFIKLYFAEMFFTTSKERIFDIRIEGEIVEQDLDIYSRVGGDTALVLQYNDIYVDDYVLTIEFLKNIQDPKVNGIEFFQVE